MKTENVQEPEHDQVPDQGAGKRLPACLLIHGYGGSPFEMEYLADALKGAGFPVQVVTLPGHGAGHAGFGATRFAHWLDHVEQAYGRLASEHERVALAGFSLGGTLALNLAARCPVAGVMTLAAPLFVLNLLPWPLTHMTLYTRSLRVQVEKWLGRRRPENTDTKAASRAIAPWKGYGGPMNIPQLASFREGCRATRELLPRITAPLLVMHDRRDALVPVGNAWEITRRSGTELVTLKLTAMRENVTKHHMLITHEETRDSVAREAAAFFAAL